MCESCWVGQGQPVAYDETVAEVAQLIRDLYVLEPTGGPLHVELDDGNVDGDVIAPTYASPGFPDRYSAETHRLADRIGQLMTPLPVPWRWSCLAHAERWAVEGVPVRKPLGFTGQSGDDSGRQSTQTP